MVGWRHGGGSDGVKVEGEKGWGGKTKGGMEVKWVEGVGGKEEALKDVNKEKHTHYTK